MLIKLLLDLHKLYRYTIFFFNFGTFFDDFICLCAWFHHGYTSKHSSLKKTCREKKRKRKQAKNIGISLKQ